MENQYNSSLEPESLRAGSPAPQDRISTLVASLPILSKGDVDVEGNCPICLVPFEAFFEESVAVGKVHDDDKEGEDQRGVTKLIGCGHVFCRKDLTEWIRSRHGTCPTCRHTFLPSRSLDSGDESSDGGEHSEDDGYYDDSEFDSDTPWWDEDEEDDDDDDGFQDSSEDDDDDDDDEDEEEEGVDSLQELTGQDVVDIAPAPTGYDSVEVNSDVGHANTNSLTGNGASDRTSSSSSSWNAGVREGVAKR